SQNKNWNVATARSRTSEEGEAVSIGQTKVEDRRIVGNQRNCLVTVGAGAESVYGESGAHERTRNQFAHASFIFDQQDAQLQPSERAFDAVRPEDAYRGILSSEGADRPRTWR